MSEEPTAPQRRTLFQVVRGEPTDAGVAALTVVFTAAVGGDGQPVAGPRSRWNDPTTLMRRPLHPGPDGWRLSALP